MNARMSVITCCRLRALLSECERNCMVVNMSVHSLAMAAVTRRGAQPPLLDVAAEVLVADPAASLAEVAAAAGIGRTTLHKHYATRDDLLRAVGHRALELLEQALNEATAAEHADGGLHALVAALIPIGPQLAFLWRTPAFDHMKDLDERWLAVEERSLAVLRRAQELGIFAADLPDWWLGQMLSSVVYVAASSVQVGRLAPLDAPGLALRTLLRGTGEPQPSLKETS
jgi:AcrR family transcriptional regulator